MIKNILCFSKTQKKKLNILETRLNDIITKNTELEKKVSNLNVTNNTKYITELEEKMTTVSKLNQEMYSKYSVLMETFNLEIKKTNQNVEMNSVETNNKLKVLEKNLTDSITYVTLDFNKEMGQFKEENLQILESINNLKNTDNNSENIVETFNEQLEHQIEKPAEEKKGWRLFG